MGFAESVTAVGGALNIILIIVGMKIKAELNEALVAMERKIEQANSLMKDELRQVELFTRDNFVRSALFDQMFALLSTNIQTQFDEIKASINRLNDKLDRTNHVP